MIRRACNPISTNASTFTTKTAVSHTEYELMRRRAPNRPGAA
jgi:hypothetical protein